MAQLDTAVAVGDEIPVVEYRLSRDSLVRYAGASGDFNPIHYRDDVAKNVGLPGVLAHGMLTMGVAVQSTVNWIGDPGRILDYQTRFTRPVVVDPDSGATLSVAGKVAQVDDEARAARVDLTVIFNGETVLGKAQVQVRLV
jgi:acyl dehydratase